VPWGLAGSFFARQDSSTPTHAGRHRRIAIIGLALEKLVFQPIEEFTVVRWGMMS